MTGRTPRRRLPPSPARFVASTLLAGIARLLCGAPRWVGSAAHARPRIYFANHSSHLDFVVIWGSLPRHIRMQTRPVAGRDYWDGTPLRRYIARRIFRAVLVDRGSAQDDAPRDATVAGARRSVERAARALAGDASLIIFPEGTRGDGGEVAPFKSGLYHLCRQRPDVELVPVFLENLNRILPKGEAIPLPVAASVTFGQPIRLRPGEEKHAFLARARTALLTVNQPCTPLSTVMSRAS